MTASWLASFHPVLRNTRQVVLGVRCSMMGVIASGRRITVLS